MLSLEQLDDAQLEAVRLRRLSSGLARVALIYVGQFDGLPRHLLHQCRQLGDLCPLLISRSNVQFTTDSRQT